MIRGKCSVTKVLLCAAILLTWLPGCDDEQDPPVTQDAAADALSVDIASPDLAPAPTCTDKVKNGAETDVDCGGGTCPTCGNKKSCTKAADCKSGVCASGACVEATCTDGVKNGDESDVD